MTEANRTEDQRACTCHPDDRPPTCQRRYAAGECQDSYRLGQEQQEIERQRAGALETRHEQIMRAVRQWNAEAKALGYEGVSDMLAAFRETSGSMERQ